MAEKDEEAGVVQLVADRLEHGRKLYGDLHLNTDKRDLLQEALEEALDLSVYLASKIIQLKNADKKV